MALISPNEDDPSVVPVVMDRASAFAEKRSGVRRIGVGLITGFVSRSGSQRPVSSCDVTRAACPGYVVPRSLPSSATASVIPSASTGSVVGIARGPRGASLHVRAAHCRERRSEVGVRCGSSSRLGSSLGSGTDEKRPVSANGSSARSSLHG